MKNILLLFVLPALLGIILRLLFRKSLRDYLVTVILGIAALILAGIAMLNPIPGNEGFGVLTIMASSVFAGSLATGIALLLISAAKR